MQVYIGNKNQEPYRYLNESFLAFGARRGSEGIFEVRVSKMSSNSDQEG